MNRDAVFQEKVIRKTRERLQESDTSTEDKPLLQKPEFPATTPTGVEEDEEGTSVFGRHAQFLASQVAEAKMLLDRKQHYTVSSKRPIDNESLCANPNKRSDMEGRGPRITPSSVKNQKRKMKKKRAKARAKNEVVATSDSTS